MPSIRYVHAADVHLDAAFRGMRRETTHAGVARRLREATFIALERLIALCEKERPHFCIIAGDIYNQEDQSLKAQMALRDGCERLNACGVRVFIAHGNHDPLSSRLHTLSWPNNTVIFGESVSSHCITLDDAELPLAVVHGISHATAREQRNLATAFSRLHTETPCFQLGVLHCTLEGMKAERYAPCTAEDLIATGLDAFALGHVHERRIVRETPFIAYPGNTQGLHIHEAGPRGCLLVTATACATGADAGFACKAVFHPLAPVRWESLTVPLDTIETVDAAENAVRDALDKAAADTGPECSTLLVRVILTGRTPLDSIVRTQDSLYDFAERLRGAPAGQPLVWLKDCVALTRPVLDTEALYLRQDLLGETLRFARDQRAHAEATATLATEALTPLFRHPRARLLLQSPDGPELDTLLDEAERLCTDLLEGR